MFAEPMSELVKRYTASVFFDKRLADADIQGSLAHAHMLQQAAGNALAAKEAPTALRLVQTSSDWLHGACATAAYAGPQAELDFEAGIAAITGDVAQGASPEQALESVRLLTLSNSLVLRQQAEQDQQAEQGR